MCTLLAKLEGGKCFQKICGASLHNAEINIAFKNIKIIHLTKHQHASTFNSPLYPRKGQFSYLTTI